MEKQILVPESLIQTTADMLEISAFALKKIAEMPAAFADVETLQQIARNAIQQGDDSRTLNQQVFDVSYEKDI